MKRKRVKPTPSKIWEDKFKLNKKLFLKNCLRKRFINVFLSYIFFELVEASSPGEYLTVFKRVFFPPKETIGNRDYIVRILKGTVKLLKNLTNSNL